MAWTIENAKISGITILGEPPEGWKKIKGATTAPRGYIWYSNGKPRFGTERRVALVRDHRYDGEADT